MRKKIHSFLIMLAFLLNVFVMNYVAQANPQNYVIVVLGSSTAQGSGAAHSDSAWVKRYQKYLSQNYPNFSVINLAYGGFKTYNILPTGAYVPPGEYIDSERNISKALSYSPSAIIINLPSNDASAFIQATYQMANYKTVTDRAEINNVPVWVCTPQPVNQGSAVTQIQLDVLSATYSVYGNFAIDFWTELATPTGILKGQYNSGDGTHLNDAGHGYLFRQVVAKNIPSLLMHIDDTTPPSIPVSLSTSNVTSNGFDLLWTASNDNVGVSGYDVYKNDTLFTAVTSTFASINGLTKATTYSMKVIAKDAAGNQSVASDTILVTTLSIQSPTTPTHLLSSNITGSGFTLSWTASNSSAGISGYNVYKNGFLTTSVASTSATISGLTNGTGYNMTVVAKDSAGNQSATSNPLLVTTLDTQAPTTPSYLYSSNKTGSSFMLSWTASTDNLGVSSYDVYKNGTWVTTVTSNSATISGLTNYTTYGMTVIANDAAGNQSAASTTLSVTTLDTQIPAAPSNLSSTNVSGTGFTLSWTASIDNVGVIGYDVYKNGSWIKYVTTTSAAITGLTNATTYNMTVIAYDSSWNQSTASNPLSVKTLDTQAPTIPNNLSSSNITGVGFSLTWTASTDNVGVIGYDIYKNGSWIKYVTTTSATITGLTNATAYNMTVIAKDAAGNQSVASNPLSVKTLDTQAPTKPTYLSSNNRTGSGFLLSWTASTDNVSVTSYNVYKNGALVSTVTSTNAIITGLVNATAYTMTVTAKDAAGNQSVASDPLSVTTLDTISPSIPMDLSSDNITGSSFILSWTLSTDNVGISCYNIYLNDTFFSTVTSPYAIIRELTSATTYSITVIAKDAAGNQSAESDALSVTTLDTIPPSIPPDLISDNITGSSFILSWTASTDNVGVSSYDVYLNDTLAYNVTSPSATISGLINATAYSMTVIALDDAGNQSEASNSLSVVTLDTISPTIPMGLSSDNITGSSFILSWTESTDNVGVSSYDVYLNDTLAYNVTSPSTMISGLISATAYIVSVIAKDDAGNASAESDSLSIVTLDTISPTIPMGLSSDIITGSSFILSWASSTDNVGVSSYDVYKNSKLLTTVTSTSATIRGLINATKYNMTVSANDAVGNKSSACSPLSVTTLDTKAPTSPTNLISSNITGTKFLLSWTPSSDNVGVSSYDVYINDILTTTVSTTFASISGLDHGVKYIATVIARDAAGNSSHESSELNIHTLTNVTLFDNQSIKIYPNPAIDIINIELTELSNVYFTDMFGKILLSKEESIDLTQISFNFKPGLYFVKVVGVSNTLKIFKLIVL